MNTQIKKRHIRDTNQLAKMVVDIATGEDKKVSVEKGGLLADQIPKKKKKG